MKSPSVAGVLHWTLHLSALFVIALLLQSRDQPSSERINRKVGSQQSPTNEISLLRNNDTEVYFAENDTIARDLYQKQRVLCWVMTGPANHRRKAKHVKATWGKRCNVLLFMSTEIDDSLPTVKLPLVEGRETLWGKTRESYRYVWEQYKDQADWFMKVDDDAFVILENLRYFLSAYNTSDPLYFGHKFKQFVKKGYMQGGSGYVLSKEGLKRFVEKGLTDPNICSTDLSGAEDVKMGDCMERLEVRGVDTRDQFGRHRFLPFTPGAHLNAEPRTKKFWLWDYIFYPIKRGVGCCSDTAIAFHYVDPKDMYTLEYLIYHVQPYGIINYRTTVQKHPASPPDASLTATPFPGPTDEDERKYEEFQKENQRMEEEIKEILQKAKALDDNEKLRNEEIERRKQSSQ